MRISELAVTTGVPVHTLKYYLREGLLMPGDAQSRTLADYGQAHVERVRLIRALVEHGGIGIVGVRGILQAITAPPPARHDLLGLAHSALPSPAARGPVSEEVVQLIADLEWPVGPQCPAMSALTSAVESARAAGVTLDPETLRSYAQAMADVATVDVGVATSAGSPEEAMRQVVVGTVMVDPVLIALRRVAQQAVSARQGYCPTTHADALTRNATVGTIREPGGHAAAHQSRA